MKQFLKEQYGKLLALKAPPTDSAAVKAIMEQWERIVGLVGQERFAKAVSRCVETMEFFPSIPDLESRIPPAEIERQICPKCRDTGGLFEKVPDIRDGVNRGYKFKKCSHSTYSQDYSQTA
jgi:hypothetical protein